MSNYRLKTTCPVSILKITERKVNEGVMELLMKSLDRNEDVKMKCVILFEPACWQINRNAADMKESLFQPSVEAINVTWDFWQHSNALLLFTAQPRVPGVHSEPQFSDYKQSWLVPKCTLALIAPNSVSTHSLTFVVLHRSHLSSKVSVDVAQ